MVRKEVKTVTKELNDLVINMVELNGKKIKDVASLVNLDRQVIRSVLKKHQQGDEYVHPFIKRKKTWQDKNQIMSSIKHIINFN
ncbi:hypothetical protein H311_01609 [Anncaliia algerae PRA109]|nr:hypothetical protein H311_01609 [Anncaliia algerae PRA109]